MIAETPVYADGTPAYEERVQWLYEPEALTPVARYAKGKLHYVVSDHAVQSRERVTDTAAWQRQTCLVPGLRKYLLFA